MTGHDSCCTRCGRAIGATPADVEHLSWSDPERVVAQGWLGRSPEDAVGVECLTSDETNFLQPEPAVPATRTRRFQRRPDFVTDWMLA